MFLSCLHKIFFKKFCLKDWLFVSFFKRTSQTFEKQQTKSVTRYKPISMCTNWLIFKSTFPSLNEQNYTFLWSSSIIPTKSFSRLWWHNHLTLMASFHKGCCCHGLPEVTRGRPRFVAATDMSSWVIARRPRPTFVLGKRCFSEDVTTSASVFGLQEDLRPFCCLLGKGGG